MPGNDKCVNRRSTDVNSCPHEVQIHDFIRQAAQIDQFIAEAEPLLGYVRAEITRNERRAEMYLKVTEHVLGASIIGIFAFVGSWCIAQIQQYLGVGK